MVQNTDTLSEEKILEEATYLAKYLVKEPANDGIRSELEKIIDYLRYAINENPPEAISKFFDYLETLDKDGRTINQPSDKNLKERTKNTLKYYKIINDICKTELKDKNYKPQDTLEILAWTSRLIRYYKLKPEQQLFTPETSTQITTEPVKKTRIWKIGEEVEAEITLIKGKEITYKLAEKIKPKNKEKHHYQSLKVEQKVIVQITELKDNLPKKVKFVRSL
ncbi:MAG: hypothetical protein AAGM40_11740 [Cyanobacteria bacterium J06573_2]